MWGSESYWLYLIGQHFTLVTDNRAVQLIFGNTATLPPARIERWALRLTQFDFDIVHRPSQSNVADYFSRHPSAKISPLTIHEENGVERYVNIIACCAMRSALTRSEIVAATKADPELTQLPKWISNKRSSPGEIHPSLVSYKNFFNELN